MSTAERIGMRNAADHIASSSSNDGDLAIRFAQLASSFKDLANDARDRGIDPFSMVMRSQVDAEQAATGTAAIEGTPTDAEITKRSRGLIDALDRADVAAVAALLSPGFVHIVGESMMDRDTILARLASRMSSPTAERTWEGESIIRNPHAVVFSGRAREVDSGCKTYGGYVYVGSYLLQWVRVGDAWRVQLLTWQRQCSNRDRWNEIFHHGQGFSRVPNRLLAETVEAVPPGAALDIAMGHGRNAIFLASRGWNVTGVDISDEGVQIAREQALDRNVQLDAIRADIHECDLGVDRFDLVTLIYTNDFVHCFDKIKASLRTGGLLVVDGWAKETPDSDVGFADGELARIFEGYEVMRDEIVDDVPDWAHDKGKLVRFVARKV
jgi:SAM-dependent methyltransferase